MIVAEMTFFVTVTAVVSTTVPVIILAAAIQVGLRGTMAGTAPIAIISIITLIPVELEY